MVVKIRLHGVFSFVIGFMTSSVPMLCSVE
jgi:hypothetical protein